MLSWLGGAVIATADDTTALSPGALKLSVRLPLEPLIDRLVKPARPSLVEVAGVVPPSVPPPEPIATVTTTPSTGLFEASRTRITGCWASTVPLCAEADGWVWMVSWLAGPAVTLTGAEETPTYPGAAK